LTILVRAQAILFKILNILEKETEGLKSGLLVDRHKKMTVILFDAYFNPDDAFKKALDMLNVTYRFARSLSFIISLPNAINDKKNQSFCGEINKEELKTFIEGGGLQHKLNMIYNTTCNRLGPFLSYLDPNSRWNVKDE
jgi:hypothetical protein